MKKKIILLLLAFILISTALIIFFSRTKKANTPEPSAPAQLETKTETIKPDENKAVSKNYQESFYPQFKVDLGDTNRFDTLGELVYEIYQTIWKYNNERIHTALRMSPIQFANHFLISEFVSKKMGT